MNDQTLDHLAALIAVVRDASDGADWDRPGIITGLRRANALGRPLPDTACACIRAAAQPTVRTPIVMAMDGDHWQTDSPKTHPQPPRYLPGVDDAPRHPDSVAHRGAAMCRDAMGNADGADALRVEYELGQLRSRLKALAPQLSDAQRDELAKALGLTTAPTDRQDTA